MSSLAFALLQLCHRSGLSELLRRRAAGRGRFVLVLHGISSRKRPDLPPTAQPFLDAADLTRILGWLTERYRLLTADELLETTTPGILLTFDDGYANNHDRALPLLLEHRAPAIFFVTTRHVSEPSDWLPAIDREVREWSSSAAEIDRDTARDLYDGMSPEELARCAASPGIEIGSHSVSHPFLTQLAHSDLEAELVESRRRLEGWTEGPIRLFAYPTGDYDAGVARAVERAGYEAAFADRCRRLAHRRRLEIPRIGLYRSEPWYLAAKLSGLHRRPVGLL